MTGGAAEAGNPDAVRDEPVDGVRTYFEDAEGTLRSVAKASPTPVPLLLLEPSDGLEPSTPSLPSSDQSGRAGKGGKPRARKPRKTKETSEDK